MTDAERNESEREKWDLLVRRLGYSVWESEGDHDLTYEQVTLFDAAEVEVAVSSELRDRILAAIDSRDRRISELSAQLAAAQADTERLDWLQEQGDGVRMCYLPPAAETLRGVIDAARATKESK